MKQSKKLFYLTLIIIFWSTGKYNVALAKEVILPVEQADEAVITPSIVRRRERTTASSSGKILNAFSALSSTAQLEAIPMSDSVEPTPSFSRADKSVQSAKMSVKPVVKKLSNNTFQAKDRIQLVVTNPENQPITTEVTNSRGKKANVSILDSHVNGQTILTVVPKDGTTSGKYIISVKDKEGSTLSSQDFTWGVLAVNTDRSMYSPGEDVNFALGVLDEGGHMVCDADISLSIEDPSFATKTLSTRDGTIIVNPECQLHAFTVRPDFTTTYTASSSGTYQIAVSAITENGTYSVFDKFEVRDIIPYRISRDTATRIYPKSKYPVKIDIQANEDFNGTVTEVVPASFHVTQLASDSADIQPFDSLEVVDSEADLDDSVLGSRVFPLPFEGEHPVSLGFGEQIDDPVRRSFYKENGLDGHDGIDFDMPEGTPIKSIDEGTVILAKENWDYGTTIVLQHSWGKSYYGHLNSMLVKEGEQVAAGTLIGLSGSTGNTTGPHLHFGMKPFNADVHNLYLGKIDPAAYLGIPHSGEVVSATTNVHRPVNVLSWDLDLKKGQSVTLGYSYKAPEISPEFYTLGPARFVDTNNKVVFQEIRRWQIASDAEVDIDTTVSTASTSHGGVTQTTVFTSDQVGYTFYRDANGSCVYKKTLNGGASWGATVTVDSQTDCIRVAIWYDQWTPGITGSIVHIGTMDTSSDDLWYTELDTTDDSLSVTVDATGANQGGTLTAGANFNTITVGTDGAVYMGTNDASDSFVIKCSGSCDTAGSWVEAGTNPFDLANDLISLVPLSGTDILAVQDDISANDYRSKVYHGSTDSWDASWTSIDTNASENSTYDGTFATSVNQANGNINLAYAADVATLGTDDDIRTAVFDDSSRTWTNATDVLTNETRGITGVGLGRDSTNSDVYVVYTVQEIAGTATTGDVYWKKSTDGMTSWGSEQGPVNSTQDDIYGAGPNAVNGDRLYVTWVEATPDDLFGDTIVDIIAPGDVTPTLLQIMRHGKWFNNGGVRQPFTF